MSTLKAEEASESDRSVIMWRFGGVVAFLSRQNF